MERSHLLNSILFTTAGTRPSGSVGTRLILFATAGTRPSGSMGSRLILFTMAGTRLPGTMGNRASLFVLLWLVQGFQIAWVLWPSSSCLAWLVVTHQAELFFYYSKAYLPWQVQGPLAAWVVGLIYFFYHY